VESTNLEGPSYVIFTFWG